MKLQGIHIVNRGTKKEELNEFTKILLQVLEQDEIHRAHLAVKSQKAGFFIYY